MKKILYLIICLFIAFPCYAAIDTFEGETVTDANTIEGVSTTDTVEGQTLKASVSCTTDIDSAQWTPVDQTDNATVLGAYEAQKFTIASQVTVTLYKTILCDNNQTGSIEIVLMTNDDNEGSPEPDCTTSCATNEVPGSSVTLAHGDITNCGAYIAQDFVLATPLVLPSGTYWMVHKRLGGSQAKFQYDASSTPDRFCEDTDGLSWTCYDNKALDIELWGCNP